MSMLQKILLYGLWNHDYDTTIMIQQLWHHNEHAAKEMEIGFGEITWNMWNKYVVKNRLVGEILKQSVADADADTWRESQWKAGAKIQWGEWRTGVSGVKHYDDEYEYL